MSLKRNLYDSNQASLYWNKSIAKLMKETDFQ